MDFQAPEPKDAFQGFVIAMLQNMDTELRDQGSRLRKVEQQNTYAKGIAAGFGFMAGALAAAFGKLIPWR